MRGTRAGALDPGLGLLGLALRLLALRLRGLRLRGLVLRRWMRSSHVLGSRLVLFCGDWGSILGQGRVEPPGLITLLISTLGSPFGPAGSPCSLSSPKAKLGP